MAELINSLKGKGAADPSGLGWDDLPGSSLSAGFKAGTAGWLESMARVAQLLPGVDTSDFIARKNAEAEFYQRNSPGATRFFGEDGVTGDGSLTDWLAYNLGQSVPYVAEMLAGGVAGGLARGAATGLAKGVGSGMLERQVAQRLGTQAATTEALRAAEAQALKDVSTRIAAGAGGVAASYPSSVGDILGNQEAAGGQDVAAALAGGVPYALLNLLGGEGAALRAATGGLGRGASWIKALPGAMAKAGGQEGIGETAQEIINQSFGRMAVNPNETLTSGDAMDRYAESFMAGMGLGGLMGGGAHVFAKPELGTKEEIAARVDNVRSELDLLRGNHETWADRVAQTAKDRADAEKEMQAEADALGKQAEKALKDAQDAKKAEQDAADTRRDAWLAEQDRRIAEAMGEVPPKAEDPVATIMQNAGFDIPRTGFVSAPGGVTPGTPMQPDLLGGAGSWFLPADRQPTPEDLFTPAQQAMQFLDLIAKVKGEPASYTKAGALRKPAEAILNTSEAELARIQALRDTPFEPGTLFNPHVPLDFLKMQEPPAPSPTERIDSYNVRNGITVPTDVKGQIAEIVAEREYEGRVAQFNNNQELARAGQQKLDFNAPPPNRDARRARLQALYDRSKRMEAEALRRGDVKEATRAAYDALDAEKAMQEELAWQQQNADPRYGMTPDMFGRSPDLAREPTQPAKDPLTEAHNFVTEGLRIGFELQEAEKRNDPATAEKLRADAMVLMNQLAQGLGKKEGTTAEMFQKREGDDRPKATTAGKAASGNMFKQPKEKTSGAQAPQAKQAKPAAPEPKAETTAGAAPAVTPSEIVVPAEVTAWDRANRTHRAEEWMIGEMESNKAFKHLENTNIPAHGMSKVGTLNEGFKKLVAMVNGGIRPGLYTEWLAKSGQTHGAGGTAGGAAYRDGPFIIVFRKGTESNPTSADIVGVLVNSAHPEITPILQQMFPQLVVRDYSQAADMVAAAKPIETTTATQPKETQNASVPAKQEQAAVPVQEEANAGQSQEETLLPELTAQWNTRAENRTKVEQLAAKGDEARIAREWNEQYGADFQYPELDRDLQLLVKHAIEAVEKGKNGRTQSKMSLDLADRIEAAQKLRNTEENQGGDIENASPSEAAQPSPAPIEEAQEEVAPTPAPAPAVEPAPEVEDPAKGIPKSFFAKVELRYDAGKGEKQGTAAQAMKEIKQGIADYTAFLKCLGG